MWKQRDSRQEELTKDSPAYVIGNLVDKRAARKQGITLQEVVEQIMACWGGPAELAKAFYDQYRVAKPGSMIRGRALERMLELIKVYQQLYGHRDDVDEMDEQEARAELKQLLGELNGSTGPGT